GRECDSDYESPNCADEDKEGRPAKLKKIRCCRSGEAITLLGHLDFPSNHCFTSCRRAVINIHTSGDPRQAPQQICRTTPHDEGAHRKGEPKALYCESIAMPSL